jgi:hypothetical protein
MLVLLYDEIRSRPLEKLAEVTSFLELDPIEAVDGDRPVGVKEDPRLPLPLRRALAPLKHAVAPLRQTRWFQAIHSKLSRPFEYPPLAETLRKKLRDHYSADIVDLEKILGRGVPHWLEEAPSCQQ